jgi:hypothetical protein
MSVPRVLAIALAGLICGGLWISPHSVCAQSMSAATGPQQMVPSSSPAAYPSAYPPPFSTYPSTSDPTAASPALTPYNSLMAQASVAAPNGAGPTLYPATPVELGTPSYGALDGSRPLDLNASVERTFSSSEPWTWQVVPEGLMYKSYLAGGREPRMGSQLVNQRGYGWLWQATVGGRAGILRYGNDNELWPQGWQLDIEGAAFPRLDLEHEEDLMSCDYRGGLLATTRQGPWEAKFGFYHISSHIGDEFLLRNLDFPRLNYVRESLVLGMAVYLNPSLRLYSEAGWAFQEDGGAKPWEFQFGAEFSPAEPTGIAGAPFFAFNGHLRQENDFGGNLTVQTGWQWRGRTGHLCRVGVQYFNGMSDEGQFFNRFEEQIGFGLWYDY